MKSIPFLVFVGVLFAGVAIAQTDDELQPVVTLGPARLDLKPVLEGGQRSSLTLEITNRTARTWRFCRFYECTHPVLLSDNGKLMEPAAVGRDATVPPKVTDFPVLKSGQTATASRGCVVKQNGQDFAFSLGDGSGTIWTYAVQPGHYKLCIQYRFTGEEGILPTAVKSLGLKLNAADVWPGWQVSNWIDLYLNKPK